jgi:phage terminase large subunit-like protein
VDILETARGSRRQPLIFEITTAGYDRHSICWQHRDYSDKVLRGILRDDAWFAYIAALDEGDSWSDEKVWPKANPNYVISCKPEIMRDMARKAAELPSAQNAFRQKHLDEWTEQAERWIPMDLWDEGAEPPIDLADLAGRECFGGLDLASTSDIASFCLIFPPTGDDEDWRAIWWNWIPREGARRRANRDRAPYLEWERTQQIILTHGDVTDYDVIREDILKGCETFKVREIAFDAWNASQLVTQLTGDGLTMVPMRQGFVTFNAPSKELEKMVLGRTFRHGGNPVARWCASNVMLEQDAAGNIKPSKAKSTEKIDAIVALVMAIWRAVLARDESSIYATQGITFLR